MNIAELRRLIKLLEASNLSELEIEEGGVRVRIAKKVSDNGAIPMPVYAFPMPGMPAALTGAPVGEVPAAAHGAVPAAKSNQIEVTSPMVGTFYRAPSPEAPPYVQLGDHVRPGQVLCIIEAMKLMNEIEAERAGRVVEILVENVEPVEFGRVLFRIEPE